MKITKKIKEKFSFTGNKQKIAKNVYWAVLGKIVNTISSLFVGILVARYLGPEHYGLMNYVVSFVSLFTIFANFGLDNIEVRELSQDGSDTNKIMGTAFGTRLLFASITYAIITIFVFFWEDDRFTRGMILLYSSTILFQTLNIIRNYFTSKLLNEYIVKAEISRTLVGFVFKIILLLLKADLIWFIFVITFDFLLLASGYLISYKHEGGEIVKWHIDKKIAWHLAKEAFPLLLSGSAVIIYQKIDQVIIRNIIDNEALGQFSVASKLIEITLFLPVIISQSISPLLVKKYQINTEDYEEKKLQFLALVMWSAILLSIAASLLSKPVILLLFGQRYVDAIPVLQIMSYKTAFIAFASSTGQIIIIERMQKYAVFRNIIGCIFSIGLNLLLIPKYGIVGSAWATIITTFIAGYFSHRLIKPYIKYFQIQNKALLYPFQLVMNRKKPNISNRL